MDAEGMGAFWGDMPINKNYIVVFFMANFACFEVAAWMDIMPVASPVHDLDHKGWVLDLDAFSPGIACRTAAKACIDIHGIVCAEIG